MNGWGFVDAAVDMYFIVDFFLNFIIGYDDEVNETIVLEFEK